MVAGGKLVSFRCYVVMGCFFINGKIFENCWLPRTVWLLHKQRRWRCETVMSVT